MKGKSPRFIFVAICAMVVLSASGCDIFIRIFGSTSLEIQNESDFGVEFVTWNDISFSESGAVYEPLLGYNVGGIASGDSVKHDVDPASSYVYFEVPGNSTDLRTSEPVTVEKGDEAVFTLLGSTQVALASVTMDVQNAKGDTLTRILSLVPVTPGDASRKAERAAAPEFVPR